MQSILNLFEIFTISCSHKIFIVIISNDSIVTQNRRAWILMKCCVSTDVRTWTNWLTFEPDPDYSPDAGIRLLSPISCALQREFNYIGKIPPIGIGLQWRVVLQWFYSPWAVGTTCRKYTCTLPSALLVCRIIELLIAADIHKLWLIMILCLLTKLIMFFNVVNSKMFRHFLLCVILWSPCTLL